MLDFKNPAAMARSLATFGDRTKRHTQRELKEPAQVLLDEVKSQLNRPGSGRVYRSRLGHGTHRASAPNEPPSPDTRELLRSAHLEQLEREKIRVIVDGKAAAQLEHGTREIAPRSYMRAALAAARARMTAEFTAKLKRGRG